MANKLSQLGIEITQAAEQDILIGHSPAQGKDVRITKENFLKEIRQGQQGGYYVYPTLGGAEIALDGGGLSNNDAVKVSNDLAVNFDFGTGDVDIAGDTISETAHGLSNGDEVTFTTTGTLPGGLSTGTSYYVVNTASDTFQVASSIGGSAIDLTDTGSGTHTCDHANKNGYYHVESGSLVKDAELYATDLDDTDTSEATTGKAVGDYVKGKIVADLDPANTSNAVTGKAVGNYVLPITKAQATSIVKENPEFVFKGYASTSDSTPAVTENDAYICSEAGSIYGISGCDQGDIIVGRNGSWIKRSPFEIDRRIGYNYYEWGDLTKVNAKHCDSFPQFEKFTSGGVDLVDGDRISWEIPIEQYKDIAPFYVGWKLQFGQNSHLDYGYFIDVDGNNVGGATKVKIAEDSDGWAYYQQRYDSIPADAVAYKIQPHAYSTPGDMKFAELYFSDSPYRYRTKIKQEADDSSPKAVDNKYHGPQGVAAVTQGEFLPNGDIQFYNETTEDIDATLKPVPPWGWVEHFKGQSPYLAFELDMNTTDVGRVRLDLIYYNEDEAGSDGYVTESRVFVNHEISHHNYMQLEVPASADTAYVRCVIPANGNSIEATFKDIKISADKVKSADKIGEVIHRDTFDAAYKTPGLESALIGNSSIQRISQKNGKDAFTMSSPTPRYLPQSIYNVKIIDTIDKATGDYRYLSLVDNQGYLYLSGSGKVEKIHIDDFISNLIQHDGSNTDPSRIDWIGYDESTKTSTELQNKLDAEIAEKYYMYDSAKNSEFITLLNSSPEKNSIAFGNGNVLTADQLHRPNGTVVTPRYTDPIVCNPTHLIVKDSGGSVLEEIALVDETSDLKWGEMKADQGSITYGSNIQAAINFIDGKTIDVDISDLSSGDYTFTLRARVYGNHTANNGSVILKDSGGSTIGTISLTNTTSDPGELADNEVSVTLGSSLTSITLEADGPAEMDYSYSDVNLAKPVAQWSFRARGNIGLKSTYEAASKRNGTLAISHDNGENWEVIFDVSLNENWVNPGGAHIHGCFYDPFWSRIYMLIGDTNATRGVYWCEYNETLTKNNVIWNRIPPQSKGWAGRRGEQYVSGYAMSHGLLFGTDAAPDGITRMNRVSKDSPTAREFAVKTESGTAIAHYGTAFKQLSSNDPLMVMMTPSNQASDEDFRTCIAYASHEGIDFQEVWRDYVAHGGNGDNNRSCIYYYQGKVIISFYLDGRFDHDHTVIIADYNL